MSTNHEPEWYAGHAIGYERAEDDMLEWMRETLEEWKALKVYSHEELWGAFELLHEASLRNSRSAITER